VRVGSGVNGYQSQLRERPWCLSAQQILQYTPPPRGGSAQIYAANFKQNDSCQVVFGYLPY
jgi:hypothetical protein